MLYMRVLNVPAIFLYSYIYICFCFKNMYVNVTSYPFFKNSCFDITFNNTEYVMSINYFILASKLLDKYIVTKDVDYYFSFCTS